MSPKHRLYIIIGVFLGIQLALLIFGVWPLILKIKKSGQDILAERGNIVATQIQSQELDRFERLSPKYQPVLDQVNGMLVDAQDPIDFITFTETAAARSGVNLEVNLLPASNQKVARWTALVFQIKGQGAFGSLMSFSQQLEAGPYLTSIQKLLMREDQGHINLEITAAVAAR